MALQNPPYHLGWKLLVARNTIAQASRFTVSLDIGPDDIPANEWLIGRYGAVAETVLEWWKNDIDDEGRAWLTKRTPLMVTQVPRAPCPPYRRSLSAARS
ncbi:hypothetical protein ACIBI9_40485 [Nonomuraea sp. NPDC050451]|uniref:hypothetical protein n=1 Tax=Nonomuraea sp. NPDC050451 TaxID=3364364 RepID=UPI003789775C